MNPARSLGPALFAGGEPLAHVWLFIARAAGRAALAFVVVRAHLRPARRPAGRPPAAADETGAQLPDEEPRGAGDGCRAPARGRRRRWRSGTAAR